MEVLVNNTRDDAACGDAHHDSGAFFHAECAQKKVVLASISIILVVSVIVHLSKFVCHLHAVRIRVTPREAVAVNTDICNMVLCCIYLPLQLLLLLHSVRSHCSLLCTSASVIERGTITAYAWSSTLESFCRYMQTSKPSDARVRSKLPLSTITGYIGGIWVLAMCMGALSGFVIVHGDTDSQSGSCFCHLTLDFFGLYHLMYSAVYISLSFVLPVTLQLVLTGLTLRTVRRREARMNKNPFVDQTYLGATSATSPPEREIRRVPASTARRQKVKSMSSIVVLLLPMSLLLCVSPYFVVQASLASGHAPLHPYPQCLYIGTVLFLASHGLLAAILKSAHHVRIVATWVCEKVHLRGKRPIFRNRSLHDDASALESAEVSVLSTLNQEELDNNAATTSDTHNLLI